MSFPRLRGLSFALIVAAIPPSAHGQEPWPSFRGERARGVSAHPVPTSWDLESGANVRWRVTIPGLSHSSPIVWGDRVFVTTAVRIEGESEIKVGLYGSPNSLPSEGVHRFQIFCLDRATGQVEWVRTAVEIVLVGVGEVARTDGDGQLVAAEVDLAG